MHIIVASKNPAKLRAVQQGFQKVFTQEVYKITGVETPSGVPDQPFGEDTFIGAHNRLHYLQTTHGTQAFDYFVALEGGIHILHGIWYCYAAVAIASSNGQTGYGTSPLYQLPDHIVAEVQQGEELGQVLARHSGQRDAKHSLGTIGLLSNGKILRDELLAEGVRMALVPFLAPQFWK